MNLTNPLSIGLVSTGPYLAPAAGKVSMQDFHFTMRTGSPLDPGLTLY